MLVRHPYRYEDSREFYSDYFDEQWGRGGLGVYKGRAIVPGGGMAGEGFGSVIAKLARKALPYAKLVGRRLLTGTAGLAGDLLSGESFESSAKKRLATAGRNIVSDFSNVSKARPPRRKTPPRKKKKMTGRGADVFG